MSLTLFQPAILLALLASSLFAVGILCIRQGLYYTDSVTGTLVSIGSTTVYYWLAAPWFFQWAEGPAVAVLIFALSGLFRPLLSANLSAAGTGRLGPTLSSTVASTGPFFGIAAGVFVLGEPLTPPLLLGAGGIVLGVGVLSWRGRTPMDWPRWALLLPMGAAALRSLAQMLTKLGLVTLPSPFMAGLSAYTVSFAFALGGWMLHQRRQGGAATSQRDLRVLTGFRWPHRLGVAWFAAAGLSNGAAIFSLNSGLQVGDLVMVSPVVATSPLFTLIFSALFYRQERFTLRVLSAVFLIVAGVVSIAVFK